MFKENIIMSWQNIINNRMRSFLTALGIVIGVMAIIALITIVNAATSSMINQFSEMGANKLMVTATGTPLKRGLTASEINNLSAIEGVSGVSPKLSVQTDVTKNLKLEKNVATEGRNEVYFNENAKLVARGRALNIMDMESKNHVCVINPELQEILFPAQDPLGQELQINGQAFKVVGITDKDVATDIMSSMQSMRGANISEGKIIIPYPVAMSMTGTNSVVDIEVMVSDTDNMGKIIADVERVLNEAFNYKEDSFSIINMDSILDMMNSMISMMSLMLAGIASISLLVGGIGIMNMMLVSVTERTTEIGLRKALGAEPSQIQIQFLIESVFLSLLGGIIGIVSGLLVSAMVINLLNAQFAVNISALCLGFGFSAGVGILFGWAPARRASKLNPIDALRSA